MLHQEAGGQYDSNDREIEIEQTGYALLTGQMSGFKSSTTSGKKTIKEEEPTSKVEGKPAPVKGKVRSKGKVRISLPTRTPEEKK